MQKAFFTLILMAPLTVLAQQIVVQPQTVVQPEVVDVAATSNIVAPQQISAPVATPQQIYVVQPAPQPVVPPQQISVVEDTPLKESKAEALRRSRMEVEAETEQRIVEKLETERMKAERERAEQITKALDGKKEEEAKPAEVAPVPVIQPAQMQPIQQAPVVSVSEADTVIATATPEIKEEIKEEKARIYVSGMGGIGDYPGVKNVQGMYAAGFAAGVIFPERLIAEGSFLMSTYDVEPVSGYNNPIYPNIKQIDQMNFLGAVKYQLLDGRIRPVLGVLAGYTKRVYSDKQYYYYQGPDITSHAFDMGLSAGADVELAKNFAVGMDFRYMWNMSYRVEGQYQASLINPQQFGKPVESLDYFLLTFGGRLTF